MLLLIYFDGFSILWDPSENNDAHKIAYLDDHNIRVWDLITAKETELVTVGGVESISKGCWNPYIENLITTAVGDSVIGYDIRDKLNPVFSIQKAHSQVVRDIDINPNNCYYFVSGGDDGNVKFWDLRKPVDALKVFCKHSHWVWCVKYNKFDSLVISSGTDGVVNLWDASSLAFRAQHNVESGLTDGLIKSYEGHEDSIYSIAWSASEEGMNWTTFASLSYDGRVVVNRIPEQTSNRILTGC
eukprot:TRINITY_DN2756_c0_g1_i15.p1 TRINITY_DN2756_c0_g1~~TRINITY_DN2756_c0_g1_i15.p1  ORF type:complete len:243 (-),score=40.05 TRINITY_DN2756_c0_g1_i15:131-859(-)